MDISNLPKRECSHCCGTGEVDDPVAIGHQMAKLRREVGLTLEQLGKRMGYSISYLSDLEHGRKTWSGRLLGEYLTNLKKGRKK